MQTKLVMLTFLFFILFSKILFSYEPSVINGVTGYMTQEFEIHAGEGESSFQVTCSGTSDYDLFLYDEYNSLEDY